jgi:hypothetical protein
MHKKSSRKSKSFCEIIKKTFAERKLFFSILFLVFSVFVFVMGTQVFSPDFTFSRTVINKVPVENVHAITLFPAADGFYGNWMGNTNTKEQFSLVDEKKCSGEDFISSDTYQENTSFVVDLSKIPDGAKIKQIDIIPCGAHINQSGSPAAIQTFYRMDGIDSKMISHILPDSVAPTELEIASWKNLNIVKLSTSALEIGIQNAGGDRGVKVGNVKMQIRYVPAKTK